MMVTTGTARPPFGSGRFSCGKIFLVASDEIVPKSAGYDGLVTSTLSAKAPGAGCAGGFVL